jgi:UDP-glucose 4-epimerase
MSGMPICLVTGGCGFIGSHMVDLLLSRGHAVRVVDNLIGGREQNIAHHAGNTRLSFRQADILDMQPDDPVFDNVSYVFHFAGIGDIVPSIERPADYMATNVQGTVKVLEGSRRAGVRKFVYAASSSCYGLAQTPTREDHEIAPQYPYALSKYLGEMSAFHWHKVYALPVNSIRIFNAYGTRSRTSGAYGAVFGVFLRQKLENAPFTVVGDGTQMRDFLYASDVATAFLAAAETSHTGEIFNLGAGRPQSVNRLVDLLGGDVTYIPKRPGEPDCTWADTSKITAMLDWKPSVDFSDGVSRMLDQIEYWREAPLWNSQSIEQATRLWFATMTKG